MLHNSVEEYVPPLGFLSSDVVPSIGDTSSSIIDINISKKESTNQHNYTLDNLKLDISNGVLNHWRRIVKGLKADFVEEV